MPKPSSDFLRVVTSHTQGGGIRIVDFFQNEDSRAHRLVRAKYAQVVARGEAVCARCGEPIAPGELWDLDHDDEDPLQRRYRRCNRAVVTHLKEALAPAARRHSREW